MTSQPSQIRSLTAGDVLTAQQVGAADGLVPDTSVKTLHRWARDGVIPAHKRVGKWFFIRHEVEAWIQAEDALLVNRRAS